MPKFLALLLLIAAACAAAGCSDEDGGDGTSGASAKGGSGNTDTGGAGNGGSTSTGGSAGAAGGPAGTGGSGSGGDAGTAGDGGSSGSSTCEPECGSHKWACWPIPNPLNDYLPNTASYTDMGDVVHDNVTCLDWQKSPPNTTRTNQDALTYCENLSLGGHDDWRLPTRVEMASITDWTRSPAIDPILSGQGGFYKTGSNWVLTVDQRGAGAGTDFAWAQNMADGIVSNARSAAIVDRARCVRGNGSGEGFNDYAVPPPNQYTELSAEEVRDNYTGLIWQRDGDASGLLTWDDARMYCENLTLGENDSWRLPSDRELATLVDEAEVAPAINRTMFPNAHHGARSDNWYWAFGGARNNDAAHWGLNFADGFTGFNAGAPGTWNYWTAAYVKCVR